MRARQHAAVFANQPRTRHERQQAHALAIGVNAENTAQMVVVLIVHEHNQVPVVVFPAAHLARAMAQHRHADLLQLAHRSLMRRVPDLVVRSSGRVNSEIVRASRAVHQILHNELRHRGATDVAVANKKDAGHESPLSKRIQSVSRVLYHEQNK